MKTPLCDFVNDYADKSNARFHMPGHKGQGILGFEKYDITEIDGADVLYSASGIIDESEKNATELFSTLHTFYSTEGSTLCIKAMLTLICKHCDKRPLILASRNAHKAFIYAGALLDFDVEWMYSDKSNHLCSCIISKEKLEEYILNCERKPDAVYVTSPDYLGNITDIKGMSDICDRYGIPLLVDNAHGAYLKFLSEDIHPITLGATMCCDSAHKTLPVLTGGAYLHLSEKAEKYLPDARDALSLHASTSPSYLILQSLDFCNAYLADNYKERLTLAIKRLELLEKSLLQKGIDASVPEPMKLVIKPLSYGYDGCNLASLLAEKKIVCEFYDKEIVVLMATPENADEDFEKLESFFGSLKKKKAIEEINAVKLHKAERVLTLRQAMLSVSEYVKTKNAVGRICAEPAVSCPPAVPVCISGELITKEIAEAFLFYGTDRIKVIK